MGKRYEQMANEGGLTMSDYKQLDNGTWVMVEPEPFVYPRWIISIPIKWVRYLLKKWYWKYGEG